MCHPSGFWLQSLNPTQPENVSGKQSLKMCLYTGSPDRLTSSYNNPQKNSLDQIVWEVMDRVNGEKISLEQDPGHRQGPGEESVPPVQNTNLPTSSLPWVFCPKEETQRGMCHVHALARAGPQYHIDSIQVRRQLWVLQDINEKSYSAENESPWERKSKARKNLFQIQQLQNAYDLEQVRVQFLIKHTCTDFFNVFI